MDKVAISKSSDREALFGETGASLGMANTIIEKDFWVCWTLKRLFELQEKDAPTLVFKGGTSLSKAFSAIRRFSEDIDLSFDRADFGYTGEHDPAQDALSNKAADRLLDALAANVTQHITGILLPALRTLIATHLGEPEDGRWQIEIDDADPQTINFHYPTAFSKKDYADMAYIQPRVKLEFGARGDPWPTEQRSIHPYAADVFPDFFQEPSCMVTVLSAQRTFWEKATALHAEFHRPADKDMPKYFSRHYYDIAMLLDTDDGKAASTDFNLLEQVARHKSVFFRAGWASYGTARAGTLRLVPPESRMKALRADYRDMAAMIFDENPPDFDEIIARIKSFESLINS